MRLLLATDGSPEALAAARLLADLPFGIEDTITLLTVVPQHGSGGAQAEGQGTPSESGATALALTREALSRCTASLTSLTRHGSPAQEILRAAEEQATDLIVAGSRGHSAVERFLVGSVAERVARHARCPVLLVRPLSGLVRRVLIGVDDSQSATLAVEWLREFPLPADAEVRLVTVLPLLDAWTRTPITIGSPLEERLTTLDRREREHAQQRLDALTLPSASVGRRVVTELRSGDPAMGLLQVAEEEATDLIVVGSHGQSAIERFLLGSVSEKVLRHAPCSVLVVKSPVERVPAAAAQASMALS